MREIEAVAHQYMPKLKDQKPRCVKRPTVVVTALCPNIATTVFQTDADPGEGVAAVAGSQVRPSMVTLQ